MFRTYKTHFEAAHFIEGHPECGRKHGHSYKLKLYINGDIDTFVDFKKINQDVEGILKNGYDHTDLGNTTCESIAKRLSEDLNNAGYYDGLIEINETDKYGVIYDF